MIKHGVIIRDLLYIRGTRKKQFTKPTPQLILVRSKYFGTKEYGILYFSGMWHPPPHPPPSTARPATASGPPEPRPALPSPESK